MVVVDMSANLFEGYTTHPISGCIAVIAVVAVVAASTKSTFDDLKNCVLCVLEYRNGPG